jgi:hypothetical protein
MQSTGFLSQAKNAWNNSIETFKKMSGRSKFFTLATSSVMGIVLPIFGFFVTFYAISKRSQFWQGKQLKQQFRNPMPRLVALANTYSNAPNPNYHP